jgi:RNA polymerase sigma factor for flagellar operon FliA
MPDRHTFERQFLENLAWIERAAAVACAKGGVKGAEADDFVSWIRVKLMEDDYAAFRRFRGDSKLTTYLATVVQRQFFEYRREQGGRWRPSAAALRLGPPAGDLEALVYRDGYTLQQAAEKLRTGGHTVLSDVELARLLARLPERAPLRPVVVSTEDGLPGAEGREQADDRVIAAEGDALRQRVLSALERAVARLEPEDRAVVWMHLVDGRSLADVARVLNVDQKPLYRRVDRLRRRLREYVEAEGIGDSDVLEILSDRRAA